MTAAMTWVTVPPPHYSHCAGPTETRRLTPAAMTVDSRFKALWALKASLSTLWTRQCTLQPTFRLYKERIFTFRRGARCFVLITLTQSGLIAEDFCEKPFSLCQTQFHTCEISSLERQTRCDAADFVIYLFSPGLVEWLNIDICTDDFKENHKTAVGEKLHKVFVSVK